MQYTTHQTELSAYFALRDALWLLQELPDRYSPLGALDFAKGLWSGFPGDLVCQRINEVVPPHLASSATFIDGMSRIAMGVALPDQSWDNRARQRLVELAAQRLYAEKWKEGSPVVPLEGWSVTEVDWDPVARTMKHRSVKV